MKKNLTKIMMMAIALFVWASASATLVEIGYGTTNSLPAPGASSTLSSGATEFIYTAASGLTNSTNSYFGASGFNSLKIGNSANSNLEVYYLEGSLTTNSASSSITALNICTTAGTTAKAFAVVYSSVYPFSASSIISAEALNSPLSSNTSVTYVAATVPATAKSFRIYRSVSVNSTAYGAGSSQYIYTVNVTVTPSGPSVSIKSGSTKDLTVMQTTTGNIVYTLGGTATQYTIAWTKDASPITPDFITDSKSGNDITLAIAPTNLTTLGDYVYTLTPSDGTNNGTVATGIVSVTTYSTPSPTFSSPASAIQTVKGGAAISDIVYAIGNATDATVSGLPSGVTGSYSNGTFTITGTTGTETTYPAVYNYTVTATPLTGYTGTALTATGTITVKDPNSKKIAVLYTSTTLPAGVNKLSAALNLYDVTVYDVATNNTAAYMDGIYAAGYDLIILHENVNSANLAALRLANYIGQVPILNTKSHMYGKAGWPAGTGNNGATTNASVTVQDVYATHPIFTGVTMTGNVVTMAGSTGIIRWASALTATTGVSVIASNSSNASGTASILENNPAGGSNKYMLIALCAANEDLTSNGLLVLKNACDYLISSSVFVAPKNTNAKILTMTIGGSAATIDETAKTATVDLLQGTNLSALAVTLTMSSGATLTVPVSLTAIDFTNPVTFTVQAEDATVSPVSYSVSATANKVSAVQNTSLAAKVTVDGSSVVVIGANGAKVKVISIAGLTLYSGAISSSEEKLPVSLEKGVYVVVVDGIATKVLVK